MKIIIIKKNGSLAEVDWKKNVSIENIYKKCTFRTNKHFMKRHTWKINNDFVSLYAKDSGRANSENKFELPPPIDNVLYFGSLAVVKHSQKNISDDTLLDIDINEWKTIFETLMGGFEDLDDEEQSEEEYVDPKDLTKQGYKKDGFVVDDNTIHFNSESDNEEEWIPSQEESNDDSLEEEDDEEDESHSELSYDSDDEDADGEESIEENENSNYESDVKISSDNELEEEEYEY